MNKTRTLLVPKQASVRDYDQYMCMFKAQGDTALRIPNSISHAGVLGRSVSFAQLIATWASTSSKRRILTWLPAAAGDALVKFVGYVHGLSAAYYANEITAEDGTNLRELLIEAIKTRIEVMSNWNHEHGKTTAGPLNEFVFIHHWPQQFLSVAYSKQPNYNDPQDHGMSIVSPPGMRDLVDNATEGQLKKRDKKRIEEILDPLGELLHQTFRNTAEHAYLDRDNSLPCEGLRCILIAPRHAQPGTLFPETLVSAEHPHTGKYFESLRARSKPEKLPSYKGYKREIRKSVFILEISVLDTGPGLSDTIAPRLDTNDDAERVTQCFVDHVTSKIGSNSGLGLGLVLDRIKKLNGFLRVRTSTTEAFYSSLSYDTRDLQKVPHVVGNLAEATGTAMTIAIPLERWGWA